MRNAPTTDNANQPLPKHRQMLADLYGEEEVNQYFRDQEERKRNPPSEAEVQESREKYRAYLRRISGTEPANLSAQQ
jgi:hypothetical protein